MIFGEAISSKIINIEKTCIKLFGKNKTKELLNKTGPKKLFICGKNENTLTLSNKAWNNLQANFVIITRLLNYSRLACGDIKKVFP